MTDWAMQTVFHFCTQCFANEKFCMSSLRLPFICDLNRLEYSWKTFLTSFLAVSAEKAVESHPVQAWNLTQFWSSVANTFLSIRVRRMIHSGVSGDILSFHPDCLIFYFVINDNVPTVVQEHLSLVKQQIEQCRTLGCSHTGEAFLFLSSLFLWNLEGLEVTCVCIWVGRLILIYD